MTNTCAEVVQEPLIKWPGGKRQLLGELRKRLPPVIKHYVEPFFGGGALFFGLVQTKTIDPSKALICDANEVLIDLYRRVAATPDLVWLAIDRLAEEYAKLDTESKEKMYYKIRKDFNECAYGEADATRLVFLNRTCFNGLWRVNKSGAVNSPWGKSEAPHWPALERYRKAAEALKGAAIKSGDYQLNYSFLRPAAADTFIYLDPPYPGGFAAYTAGGGAFSQKVLFDWAQQAVVRGAKVMVSNADHPEIHQLYGSLSGWRIDVVQARRAINRDGAGRTGSEVIITSY